MIDCIFKYFWGDFFYLHIAKTGFSCTTLILFYKQRFISNTKYEKTSWTIAYKTERVYLVDMNLFSLYLHGLIRTYTFIHFWEKSPIYTVFIK